MNSRSKRTAISIGLLVSAALLFFTFRGLRPEQFLNNLRQLHLPLLVIAVLIYFLAVAVIALRWQFLLRAAQRIPLHSLIRIVTIGYMGNTVYPLRAGEALRAYLLHRNHQVPFARASATILVERVFDGLVMLSFVLLGLLLTDVQSAQVKTIAAVTAPLFAGAVLVLFFLAAQPNRLRQLIHSLLSILPQQIGTAIGDISEDIIAGLRGLRSRAYLTGAGASSFVTWALEAIVYWVVMFAFGLELSYPLALLIVGTVNLAGLIPVSPGQVGVYEFVASAILIAAGLPAATAAAYAVVAHIIVALPVTVVGFVFLVRQGMGWSDIKSVRELETSSPA